MVLVSGLAEWNASLPGSGASPPASRCPHRAYCTTRSIPGATEPQRLENITRINLERGAGSAQQPRDLPRTGGLAPHPVDSTRAGLRRCRAGGLLPPAGQDSRCLQPAALALRTRNEPPATRLFRCRGLSPLSPHGWPLPLRFRPPRRSPPGCTSGRGEHCSPAWPGESCCLRPPRQRRRPPGSGSRLARSGRRLPVLCRRWCVTRSEHRSWGRSDGLARQT